MGVLAFPILYMCILTFLLSIIPLMRFNFLFSNWIQSITPLCKYISWNREDAKLSIMIHAWTWTYIFQDSSHGKIERKKGRGGRGGVVFGGAVIIGVLRIPLWNRIINGGPSFCYACRFLRCSWDIGWTNEEIECEKSHPWEVMIFISIPSVFGFFNGLAAYCWGDD